jgi:hypothetical protein
MTAYAHANASPVQLRMQTFHLSNFSCARTMHADVAQEEMGTDECVHRVHERGSDATQKLLRPGVPLKLVREQ